MFRSIGKPLFDFIYSFLESAVYFHAHEISLFISTKEGFSC